MSLFRASSDSEPDSNPQPPAKRPRFFNDSDEDSDPNPTQRSIHLLDDSDDDEGQLTTITNTKDTGTARDDNLQGRWSARYFGEVFVSAFALSSSNSFVNLKPGEKITLERIKPQVPLDKDGKRSKAQEKKLENDVVRFSNARGVEVGRIAKEDSSWLAKLMDLELLDVGGYCVHCNPKFRSGEDISLSLTISLRRTAFINPNSSRPSTSSTSSAAATGADKDASTSDAKTKKAFHDSLLETSREKTLRERKRALNTLFDKADLQPVLEADEPSSADAGKGKPSASQSQSKRAMLSRLERSRAGAGGEDEEEDEMSEIQLNLVYSKATRNDASLPEMDPPGTFGLTLRPYQKQALKWMSSMETGEANARKSLSLHPLWEKYRFPRASSSGKGKGNEDEKEGQGGEEFFYYNPYSGELSLIFPRASTKCRGGILADEMGLGKTIMVASLIHTNTPYNAPSSPLDANLPHPGNTGAGSDSDSSLDLAPAPRKAGPTQSRLTGAASSSQPSGEGGSRALATFTAKRPRLPAGTARATLVVAPVTLLSQWCDELERSNSSSGKGKSAGGRGRKDGLRVLMHYGNGRSSGGELQREIEAGEVDVVVTSYGVLQSDYKQSGLASADKPAKKDKADKDDKGKGKVKEEEDGDGKKKKKKSGGKKKMKGLFAVEWFRIVLDEAHLIKSRTTLSAKAAYALKGARRWALTGTPIVNRLEDLYSLLHYIQLEPWGNFSFFKTFVTVPFQNKDPRAIEVIQVILESILLRREKSMRDAHGQPIVVLPPKHISVVKLDFTPDERAIYRALYSNARSKFLGYAKEGTVLQHVTAIFAILTRLRQAVLHPSLVLKKLKENLAAQGIKLPASDDNAPLSASASGEMKEATIARLIERYTAGRAIGLVQQEEGEGGSGSGAREKVEMAIGAVLDVDEDPIGVDDGDCPLCMEPLEIPVWMPRCSHSACKGCVLSHLEDLQNAGEEPRCPICRAGPLTEREIAFIQNADGTRAPFPFSPRKKAAATKKGYAVSTYTSSPGSTKEVLTLLDSDEEDEASGKPPSPKKKKAKIEEITLDTTDDDDDEGTGPDGSAYEDSDAPSDSFLPTSARRRRLRGAAAGAEDSDGDAAMGDVNSSASGSDNDDDEAADPSASGADKVDYAGEAEQAKKRAVLLAQGDFRSSTKLDALIEAIKAAKEKDPDLKAVVFSQFTGFLDLIERKMNAEKLNYLRLDGTQSQPVRQKVVRKFTKNDGSVVLLASTKAGGVGLNLIAADHVWLLDCWWNNAIEQQAIDRIHRFGQTRDVYVTRFLISPSIDDKMIALQERKTKVIQGALGGAANKDKSRKQLAEDLAMIFADDE
ncbi:hypothetical protein JCM10207_005118 [Rhodosporidiobolus poonsookiae]